VQLIDIDWNDNTPIFFLNFLEQCQDSKKEYSGITDRDEPKEIEAQNTLMIQPPRTKEFL